MAPSATAEIGQEVATKQPEKHVHGAEDKTPLEAISHGPLIHPGKISSGLSLPPRIFTLCCPILSKISQD